MRTLIGSNAIKYHFPEFPREPKDVDAFAQEPWEDPRGRVDAFYDPRLEAWDWKGIATPDELYTLKISHSFWDIQGTWNKHAFDVGWLSDRGCTFIRPLYDIVLPIWKDNHRKHKTNLFQTKEQFFGDAVVRKYDHDSVHHSVAYYDRPLFERILRDGEDVAVDNDKFWAMDEDTKHKLVREEIYATALERWVIPSNYTCSPRAAYAQAFKKTAISLFKGEWALYLMLNYNELRDPDCDYVARHRENADRLIPLEG